MIDNDAVGLFALLSSAFIAGVFVYVNHLLNAEARAAASRKKKKALAATIVKAAECCSPPPNCCTPEGTTLDA